MNAKRRLAKIENRFGLKEDTRIDLIMQIESGRCIPGFCIKKQQQIGNFMASKTRQSFQRGSKPPDRPKTVIFLVCRECAYNEES
jgi:hypothetical protein